MVRTPSYAPNSTALANSRTKTETCGRQVHLDDRLTHPDQLAGCRWAFRGWALDPCVPQHLDVST